MKKILSIAAGLVIAVGVVVPLSQGATAGSTSNQAVWYWPDSSTTRLTAGVWYWPDSRTTGIPF